MADIWKLDLNHFFIKAKYKLIGLPLNHFIYHLYFIGKYSILAKVEGLVMSIQKWCVAFSMMFFMTVVYSPATYGINLSDTPHSNMPPVANAGQDQVVTKNTQVILDGSRSIDPDGRIVSYSWVQLKQPQGVVAYLSEGNTVKPTFIAPNAIGLKAVTLMFQLTVVDNEGSTAKDTVSILVNEPVSLSANPEPTCGVGLAEGAPKPYLVAEKSKIWTKNTLKVAIAFSSMKDHKNYSYVCGASDSRLICEDKVKSFIMKSASEWSAYGSIKFEYTSTWSDADIRIRFDGKGANSSIGTDAQAKKTIGILGTDVFLGTMNLAENWWYKSWIETTVTHEFGHAIGLSHEHKRADTPYILNKDNLYKFHEINDGWSKENTDKNVLNYINTNVSSWLSTDYDDLSIMRYPLAKYLNEKDEKGNPKKIVENIEKCPAAKDSYYCVNPNNSLSRLDAMGISKLYPLDTPYQDSSPSNAKDYYSTYFYNGTNDPIWIALHFRRDMSHDWETKEFGPISQGSKVKLLGAREQVKNRFMYYTVHSYPSWRTMFQDSYALPTGAVTRFAFGANRFFWQIDLGNTFGDYTIELYPSISISNTISN